jgi:N-acetyl-gamma-glutamyl-phosphate reductase
MVRVGIYGATGFTGYELIKMFAQHPHVEVGFASSTTYEHLLVAPEQAPLDQVEVAMLCTPSGVSATLALKVLAAGVKCIDFSADFRLRNMADFKAYYGDHRAPELLPQAVYGLPEIYRAQIATARLVANPGCYPTGPILALTPLLRRGLVTSERIIIDAKSGVSGAGAEPTAKTHFVNVHDNFSAYNIGHVHRHVPEIEQELNAASAQPLRVVFSPHLLPVSVGILATIYVNVDPTWTPEKVVALWREVYQGEPFLHILDAGKTATLAHVVNTNRAALSVTTAGAPGELIIVTTIDNLIKGASGQAVQALNVMMGLPETAGLVA